MNAIPDKLSSQGSLTVSGNIKKVAQRLIPNPSEIVDVENVPVMLQCDVGNF